MRRASDNRSTELQEDQVRLSDRSLQVWPGTGIRVTRLVTARKDVKLLTSHDSWRQRPQYSSSWLLHWEWSSLVSWTNLLLFSTDHQFVHKWVLLTDPEDKESGAKGYVKISISILGPGDKLKIPPKSSSTDDLVDIESNLLRPAGVQLQPATYTVKIYKAEDVPKSKFWARNLKWFYITVQWFIYGAC